MQTASIIGLLGSAIAAWTVLFKVVPYCMASTYRSDLWKIRDEFMDRLRGGEIRRSAATDRFVGQVEARIRLARDLTPFRVLTFWWIAERCGHRWSHTVAPQPPAEPEERKLLHAFEQRVQRADGRHLLFGSPSSWLLGAVAVVVAAFLTVWKMARRGVSRVRPQDEMRSIEQSVGQRTYGDPAREDALQAWRAAGWRRHRSDDLAAFA